MAVGKQLSSCDYDITHGHAELAAQKTFKLVNHTIACATNYSPNGSLVSVMWERLLQNQEKKPKETMPVDLNHMKQCMYACR